MCLFRPGQTIVPSSKSLKTLGIQHLLAWIACKPCILKRPGNNDLLQWHENACCRTYTLSDKNLKISKKIKDKHVQRTPIFFFVRPKHRPIRDLAPMGRWKVRCGSNPWFHQRVPHPHGQESSMEKISRIPLNLKLNIREYHQMIMILVSIYW